MLLGTVGYFYQLLWYYANMSKNTIVLTDQDFDIQIKNSRVPVLVDFWAEWCGPCKMIAPVLDGIAADYRDKMVVGKLDVDANPKTATAFSIMSIPTLLLFRDGQKIASFVGYQPKSVLAKSIDKVL